MKKFFVMFAIAGALVACNDNASKTDAAADSARIADSIRVADSIKMATPAMPTDTATMPMDTARKSTTDTSKH
jgi:hypothetical protein